MATSTANLTNAPILKAPSKNDAFSGKRIFLAFTPWTDEEAGEYDDSAIEWYRCKSATPSNEIEKLEWKAPDENGYNKVFRSHVLSTSQSFRVTLDELSEDALKAFNDVERRGMCKIWWFDRMNIWTGTEGTSLTAGTARLATSSFSGVMTLDGDIPLEAGEGATFAEFTINIDVEGSVTIGRDLDVTNATAI